MNENNDIKDNKNDEKKQEENDVKTTQIEIKENVEPDDMVTLPSGKVVSKRKYEAIKKLQEKRKEYYDKIKTIMKQNDKENQKEIQDKNQDKIQDKKDEFQDKKQDKKGGSALFFLVLILFGGLILLIMYLKNKENDSDAEQ